MEETSDVDKKFTTSNADDVSQVANRNITIENTSENNKNSTPRNEDHVDENVNRSSNLHDTRQNKTLSLPSSNDGNNSQVLGRGSSSDNTGQDTNSRPSNDDDFGEVVGHKSVPDDTLQDISRTDSSKTQRDEEAHLPDSQSQSPHKQHNLETDIRLENIVDNSIANTQSVSPNSLQGTDNRNQASDNVSNISYFQPSPNPLHRPNRRDENADVNNFSANKQKPSSHDDRNQDSEKNVDVSNSASSSSGDNSTEQEKRELKRKILIILIAVYCLAFLSSFSYWIQSGVLPYLTRKIGVTPVIFGYLESSYAFYQMITSPLFGRLGDVLSVRFIFILSEVGASVAYGSLALANSIPALFFTRVPALFMHGLQCAYMVITDVTLPENRADSMGKLGVAHGLGMIFGAFVGGVVAELFGEKNAALIAACGSLCSIVIICGFIPAHTKPLRRQLDRLYSANAGADDVTANDKVTLGLTEIVNVLKYPNLKFVLLVKMLIALPYSLVYAMFSMAIMDYYHLGPKTNGLLLAYIGGLSIFVQGFVIGFLTKRFSDYFNIKLAVFLSMIGFMFLMVSHDIITLVIVLLPLGTGGSISHILLMAIITKVVAIKDTGSALGLVFALHAIVRALAPTTAGQMFTHIGWPFFGVIGYVMHLVLIGYVLVFGEKEHYQ